MSETQQFELLARREAVADLVRRRMLGWLVTTTTVVAMLAAFFAAWAFLAR